MTGMMPDKTKEEYEKLFVYGIFLGEGMRNAYEMKNPSYSTVPQYVTVGEGIVQAVKVDAKGVALTGLLVDVPKSVWPRLDRLETGYSRVRVKTHGNTTAFMYAVANDGGYNHSTVKSY